MAYESVLPTDFKRQIVAFVAQYYSDKTAQQTAADLIDGAIAGIAAYPEIGTPQPRQPSGRRLVLRVPLAVPNAPLHVIKIEYTIFTDVQHVVMTGLVPPPI